MSRREEMRRWLRVREQQGLTFRELSAQVGVPVGTLASWAWKLRREQQGAERRGREPGFVELVPISGPNGGRIEIVLAGDRRVLVSGEVDESALVRVVRALERC